MADDDGFYRLEYREFEIRPVTPEERRKAQLTVCDYAKDATLARHLLEVLGLDA